MVTASKWSPLGKYNIIRKYSTLHDKETFEMELLGKLLKYCSKWRVRDPYSQYCFTEM